MVAQSQYIRKYMARGFSIIPIPAKSKAPVIPGWQNIRVTESNSDQYFRTDSNIGVLLGKPSGWLIDIDLDCAEAVAAAPQFFPSTSSFGRLSRPRSHLLYKCASIETKKFQHHGMILEIRSTGTQTIFPGSVHPDGEPIEFTTGCPRMQAIDYDLLLTAAGRTATAALLARLWHEMAGSRHEASLALSGALIGAGWPVEETAEFIRVICAISGDDEGRDRVQAVIDTAKKQANGGKRTGWPSLSSLAGDDVTTKIREWLAIADDPNHGLIISEKPAGNPGGVLVTTINGCHVKPEPVSWLWSGWLAAGKLHIIAGRPGDGKTTIALTIAAVTTAGGRFPDGQQAPIGDALIWSGEDTAADTLVPRLLLAGADMSRVHFVDKTIVGELKRPFDPAIDMQPLADAVRTLGNIRLVIVDPIVSMVAGDSNMAATVRRSLQPLSDLAASTDCAALGISHFTKNTAGKNPLERLTGSLTFGAAARIVWGTAQQQGGEARVLVRVKNNLSAGDGGFEYAVTESALPDDPLITSSTIAWGRPIEGNAEDILGEAEGTGGEGGSADEVREWLRALLANGPVNAADGLKLGEELGFSENQIFRARRKLGVISDKPGYGVGWAWSLPNAEESEESTCNSSTAVKSPPEGSEESTGNSSEGVVAGDLPKNCEELTFPRHKIFNSSDSSRQAKSSMPVKPSPEESEESEESEDLCLGKANSSGKSSSDAVTIEI